MAVFANTVAKVDGEPQILGAYNFCLSSRLAGYLPYLTGISQSQQHSLRTQPIKNLPFGEFTGLCPVTTSWRKE